MKAQQNLDLWYHSNSRTVPAALGTNAYIPPKSRVSQLGGLLEITPSKDNGDSTCSYIVQDLQPQMAAYGTPRKAVHNLTWQHSHARGC